MNSYSTFNEAYYKLVETAKSEGVKSRPRGFDCLELRPYSFTIMDPTRAIYTGKSRGLNLRFFAIETLGYLAGLGGEPGDEWYVDLLCSVNKNYTSFVNPETKLMDGAYGTRLKKSLFEVQKKLDKDPSCRQGVCSIWEPGVPQSTTDVPCTTMLHFINGASCDDRPKLDLYVYMRSNDLNWGTPYDVAAFTTIQQMMAGWLEWDLGKYVHTAGSLHVYENSLPNVAPHWKEEFTTNVRPIYPDLNMDEIRGLSQFVLECVYTDRQSGVAWKDMKPPDDGDFEEWFYDLFMLGKVK